MKLHDILHSIDHCEELTKDSVIDCLKGKYWELIIEDLRMTAEECRKV